MLIMLLGELHMFHSGLQVLRRFRHPSAVLLGSGLLAGRARQGSEHRAEVDY